MSGRIFYGWWVVAASFTVCFVGFGNAYTFSTFLATVNCAKRRRRTVICEGRAEKCGAATRRHTV